MRMARLARLAIGVAAITIVVPILVEPTFEDVVALGRGAGVTWDEIAAVLGVTRQGAQKRYGQGRLP